MASLGLIKGVWEMAGGRTQGFGFETPELRELQDFPGLSKRSTGTTRCQRKKVLKN